VRRLVLQRWTVILLILARLVLGELSHAMPHPMPHSAAGAIQHEQTSTQADCPDHASVQSVEHDVGELVVDAHSSPAGDDCCMTGCDCPCAYMSAFALVRELSDVSWLTTMPHVRHLAGAPRLSADGIFRPPADTLLDA
jgi:hypothetical protein